jgi:hypothetical protein
MHSNVALTGAAEEVTSGVILADEVYGTLATLGCDWDALVVVHVDDVSVAIDPLLGVGASSSSEKEPGRTTHGADTL